MTAKKVINHRTKKKIFQHAYFPALITCIAFLDFLSGLHAGTLIGHNETHLLDYRNKFMDSNKYQHLELMYVMLRHKIAHLAYPYIVFDTSAAPARHQFAPRRVTWAIYACKRTLPIEVKDFPSPRSDLKTSCPWPLTYNSRMLVSIRSFQADIIDSIAPYLNELESNKQLKTNFEKCMNQYFPV